MIPKLIYPNGSNSTNTRSTIDFNNEQSLVTKLYNTWKNQDDVWKKIQEPHPDIIASSNSSETPSIAQIRSFCKELTYRPHQLPKKICIIWNLDLASIQAQNALLKTLEEPPKYVEMVIVVAHPQNLLPTIRSRLIDTPISLKQNILKEETEENNSTKTGEKNELESLIAQMADKTFWHKQTVSNCIDLASSFTKSLERKDTIHWLAHLTSHFLNHHEYPSAWHANCIEIIQETSRAVHANGNTQLQVESGFLKIQQLDVST